MYSFIGTVLTAITVVVIAFLLIKNSSGVGALGKGLAVDYGQVTGAFQNNPKTG